MKKTYCDICGREISGFIISTEMFLPWLNNSELVQTKKDVCGRCQEKIATFIKQIGETVNEKIR